MKKQIDINEELINLCIKKGIDTEKYYKEKGEEEVKKMEEDFEEEFDFDEDEEEDEDSEDEY